MRKEKANKANKANNENNLSQSLIQHDDDNNEEQQREANIQRINSLMESAGLSKKKNKTESTNGCLSSLMTSMQCIKLTLFSSEEAQEKRRIMKQNTNPVSDTSYGLFAESNPSEKQQPKFERVKVSSDSDTDRQPKTSDYQNLDYL